MSDQGAWSANPWSGGPGGIENWPSDVSLRWSADAARGAAAARAARPRVPAGPRWLPAAALLAGLVGALSVPGSPPGLGVTVTAVAIVVALLPALRSRITTWTVVAGSAALGLAGLSVVRDAEWLVALDLLAAFAVGSIVLAGGVNFRELLRGAASLVLAAPMAAAHVGKPLAARTTAVSVRRLGAPARAIGLTAALVAIFGALFSSADAAFGRLASGLIPSVSFDLLPVRIAFFVLMAALVSSGALVAARVAPVGISAGLHTLADVLLAPLDPARVRLRPSRVEWVLPLAVLDVLFVAFVAVQFAVFFGGREHLVSTPGLTAAEYARSGFFQLLAVCVLTLAVIAAAMRWVDAGERARLRLLLGPLCVLTGVVLASAALRLRHYEDAFGYTRLRLFVFAAMAVIATVLLLLLGAGALWRARWLPRAVLAAGAIALLTLNVMNADGFIARRNIDRARAGATLDTYYLSGLSADAVPELLRLPEPARSCVLASMQARRGRFAAGGWRGANIARNRARSLLAGAGGLQGASGGTCGARSVYH